MKAEGPLIGRAVARYLKTRKEILAGYIFGSTANDRQRPDSDVDIAVLLNTTVPISRYLNYRLQLMADLGSLLGSDVDLVILNQATPLLAHRVLSKGKLIFERSAKERVRFQVRTASLYSDLIPMFETQIRYLKKQARGKAVG
jgi:predicted nucleotidyltransferase